VTATVSSRLPRSISLSSPQYGSEHQFAE
jgi:hypothetical protein